MTYAVAKSKITKMDRFWAWLFGYKLWTMSEEQKQLLSNPSVQKKEGDI